MSHRVIVTVHDSHPALDSGCLHGIIPARRPALRGAASRVASLNLDPRPSTASSPAPVVVVAHARAQRYDGENQIRKLVTSDPETKAPAPSHRPGVPRDDRPLWKRLLPFVLAAALIWYVVHKLDLQAFLRHLRSVHYPSFLAFVALFTVANLAADAVATSFVYRRTICPVKTSEFFLIRGASYLPSLLNHHVGQAWLTWYVSRSFRAPLWRVAGATLLVYATTFGSLFLFGALALFFEHDQQPWLAPTIGVGTVAGIGYLIVIHKAPGFLAKRQVLAPLFEVGVIGHIQALALRIPHMIVLFAGSWLPFWFFGVKIPAGAAFAYVPVLMVVQALPITPQGVGTRDVFAHHYFSRFAPGDLADQQAAVAATTLTFVVALALIQVGFSMFLMQRAIAALSRADNGATTVGPNADGHDPP